MSSGLELKWGGFYDEPKASPVGGPGGAQGAGASLGAVGPTPSPSGLEGLAWASAGDAMRATEPSGWERMGLTLATNRNKFDLGRIASHLPEFMYGGNGNPNDSLADLKGWQSQTEVLGGNSESGDPGTEQVSGYINPTALKRAGITQKTGFGGASWVDASGQKVDLASRPDLFMTPDAYAATAPYAKTEQGSGGYWDTNALKAAGLSAPPEKQGLIPFQKNTIDPQYQSYFVSNEGMAQKNAAHKQKALDYFGSNYEVATIAGPDKKTGWSGAHAIRDKTSGKTYYLTDPTVDKINGFLTTGNAAGGKDSSYRHSYMNAAGADYTMGDPWSKEFYNQTGRDQSYVDRMYDGYVDVQRGRDAPTWGVTQSFGDQTGSGSFRATTKSSGNDYAALPDYFLTEFNPFQYGGGNVKQQGFSSDGFAGAVNKVAGFVAPMVGAALLGPALGAAFGSGLSSLGLSGTSLTGLSGTVGKALGGATIGAMNSAGNGGNALVGALTGGLGAGAKMLQLPGLNSISSFGSNLFKA